MLLEFLAVGAGGFFGSCLRFGITRMSNYFCVSFPFGTLISNVIAGIAIGFIIGMEQQSGTMSPKTRLLLTTGLLGGLSTFSTFSMETIELFNAGKPALAIGNIVLNLGLSLLGVVAGMFAASMLFRKA